VLPEGPIGCIARRFEITPERLTHLVPSLARLLLGSNGPRNSARANDREKGTLNGVIHPQPAKRDATRLAIVHPAAGCNCSAGYDASLPSSGGSIYARIGDSGAGPPTKRRRAWAHHGDGWWVRCC